MIPLADGSSILLVEDEARLRQTLARSLAGRNYHVVEASTAAEARVAIAGGRYRVMLLDVNLPDATGWDVLRGLSQSGLAMPVVIMSAVPPSPARVREFRPFGILYKPFPIDALVRLVQAAGGDPPPRDHLVPSPTGPP